MNQADTLLSIKKTLAYFDQFSYPLTAEELYSFLWQPPAGIIWRDFLEILDASVSEQTCARVLAYYMLPGREQCAEGRRRSLLLVESKMALARRTAKVLGAVPFIRGIFVCNTVAAGWPTKDSDIDVLIVAQTGRMWFVRLAITVVASVLNFRRGKKYIADRICLSFYITDTHLDLANVRISEPDIYLAYWLYQLVPIFDEATHSTTLPQKNSGQVRASLLTDLQSANNWTRGYVPNARGVAIPHPDKIVKLSRIRKFCKKNIELFLHNRWGNWLENICRRVQRARIDGQSHGTPPAVVISDTMLKFHEADRREEYQAVWLAHPANQNKV